MCYKLLNHGVSTQHIPSIIQTVLKKLANIDISTTSTGRIFGLGLQDHYSGDAQSQIDGLELLLDELASCIGEDEDVEPNPFAGREAHINEF